MNLTVDTVTVGVIDLPDTLEFYEHGFGFRVERRSADRATLALGGHSALELCDWNALAIDAGLASEGSGFRGFTISHAVDSADAVEQLLGSVTGAGGEVLTREPDGAYLADLDGFAWRVAQQR